MNELLKGHNNYFTVFSCKSLDNKGNTVNMKNYICFSAGTGDGYGFYRYNGEQEFNIIIYKGLEKTLENKNHLCPFTLEQIKDHIEALNLVTLKDEFKLLEITENDEKYDLKFIINSEYTTVYAFILTWIRYLWERPYVYATMESFKLKEVFQDLDPFCRYTIARVSIPNFLIWGTGHSAIKAPDRYYKPNELKERLHQEGGNLNRLYDSQFKTPPDYLPEEIDGYRCDRDLDYWSLPELFEKRIKNHKQNKKYYDEKEN